MRIRAFTTFSKPFLFLGLSLALFLTGCFNPLDYKAPDDGRGLIHVTLPGAGTTKTAITGESGLSYELSFSGPGGQRVDKTASWGETCTVEVNPGAWTVTVKARDAADSNKIKAVGETLVNVQAGSQNNADIKLAVYTEVDTWAGLKTAIETSTQGDSGYADEFIVITGNLNATEAIVFSHNKTLTMAAPSTVSITRSGFPGILIEVNDSTRGAELILGSPAYPGEITFDGSSSGTGALIKISSGKLTMNNGTTLTGNTYSAVYCMGNGTFTMNGGKITRNSASSGAAVYTTGEFIMNSGVIGGSAVDANNATMLGGAVYITTANGQFTMNGGEISHNTAGTGGGGVSVNYNGAFTMNGGLITANTASAGAGVFNSETFNIGGAALVAPDNDVYLASGKTITVTGALTQSPAVTVTPFSTVTGTQILTLGFPAGTTGKVAFTDPAHALDAAGKLITPALVTLFSLNGKVTAPAKGAGPVTTGIDTTEYTGTVAWQDSSGTAFTGSVFAPGTVYKAVINLAAKTGYTFNGLAAGNFSYTGAAAVNQPAGTGINLTVTITFPATAVIAGDRKTITASGKTFAMRYVPAGSFEFGYGTYTSTLTKGYWIGETEVTQELWQAIMTGSEGNPNPSTRNSDPAAGEEQGKRPVETISWYDALEFCNRLSAAVGLEPVYTLTVISRDTDDHYITNATVSVDWTKNGYRLPREMEWWWAAMGASTATGAAEKAFSGSTGSNNMENYAWYQGTFDEHYTHQVGKKQANELNIYDMTGNVSEWCWDWHGTSDFFNNHTDYIGPVSGTTKVVKGGHCEAFPTPCALDQRANWAQANPANYIGLRIVCNQE
ncbi:MAG: SUMF1/EgtB/PvdO family nonheme iron enzyme [Spirochaetaceae bacterium]|jgi:formylglycine-generating enzyme required for sulfatase activity|nr:SUMF1/EgtB/PvdO family nonheme iron enzyme [Spirochaetaceae bacterium]